MSGIRPASRADFVAALAVEAAGGAKALVTAPLGAGKSHTLHEVRRRLEAERVPILFIDLFTAASTPERLLAILADRLAPFLVQDEARALASLAAESAIDRRQSSGALLRLFDLLAYRGASLPFVWLIDELTEIRSLAYFPGLLEIEKPFARVLANARGAVFTSSYPGLAVDLFPDFASRALPGVTADDVHAMRDAPRISGGDLALPLDWTSGHAAPLLLLLKDIGESRRPDVSLTRLLRPGAPLEELARRQYDILLMRSRGYAVCKRAAEAVAAAPGLRLTDLFPSIGRTPGASRQYLRWLVEVGLLRQTGKRYDFADPILGLWASLYLGRADRPEESEILDRVNAWIAGRATTSSIAGDQEAALPSRHATPTIPADDEHKPTHFKRRPDRFEEFD